MHHKQFLDKRIYIMFFDKIIIYSAVWVSIFIGQSSN